MYNEYHMKKVEQGVFDIYEFAKNMASIEDKEYRDLTKDEKEELALAYILNYKKIDLHEVIPEIDDNGELTAMLTKYCFSNSKQQLDNLIASYKSKLVKRYDIALAGIYEDAKTEFYYEMQEAAQEEAA